MPVNHGRSHEQSQSGHSFFTTTHDIETLAEEQGVSPITDFDQLLGDFWPEDEEAGDIISFGQDANGELYLVRAGIPGTPGTGAILRLVAE